LGLLLIIACGGSNTDLGAAFDSQKAFAHVRALAVDIGTRPAGTAAEAAAADYIAEQLAAYGYQVDQQLFSFAAFIDLGTTLEVLSSEDQPAGPVLNPLPMQPSIAGELEAEIAEAGLGRPEDLTSENAGRIALIRRGETSFSDKIANAAAAGALAAIIYNNQPGQFEGQLSAAPPIPAVSLSQEEGQILLDLLKEGPVRVRLAVRVELGPRDSQNVIARPPDGQCRLYVGGHYDSVAVAPGANDNVSGTATVIEIARVLASDGEFDEVCFIAFAAEEVSLIGSNNFVSLLPNADRDTVLGLLNFDVVGAGSGLLFDGTQRLIDIASLEAGRLGLIAAQRELPRGANSDHASFIAAGMPAMIIYRDDPNIHSAADKVEFVNPDLLAEAGRLGLGVIDAILREMVVTSITMR